MGWGLFRRTQWRFRSPGRALPCCWHYVGIEKPAETMMHIKKHALEAQSCCCCCSALRIWKSGLHNPVSLSHWPIPAVFISIIRLCTIIVFLFQNKEQLWCCIAASTGTFPLQDSRLCCQGMLIYGSNKRRAGFKETLTVALHEMAAVKSHTD